jgi:hypothetical protein
LENREFDFDKWFLVFVQEKHNSCPICRFELRTEDEDYEKRKQQDHNAKEQRRHIQIALKEEEMLNM